MNEKRIPKVAGYGRSSTDKQQLTPEVQEEIVLEWFKRMKDSERRFPNGAEWAGFFCETVSAKVPMIHAKWGSICSQR